MLKNVMLIGAGVVLTLVVLAGVGLAFAQAPTPTPYPFGPGMMGGRGGMMGGFGGMMGGWRSNGTQGTGNYGSMHEYMTQAFASALGITDEELDAQLAKGQSMWQIAQAKGYTEAQFSDLMLKTRTEAFKKMVADGVLTQAQADLMLNRMNSMMGNGSGGGFGGCMGGGYGRGQAPVAPQSTAQPSF